MKTHWSKLKEMINGLMSSPLALIIFIALLLLLGCSKPQPLQSDNGLYHLLVEEVDVELVFNLEAAVGQTVTVTNANSRVIGVYLEDYDHAGRWLFRDNWIASGDSETKTSSNLEEGQEIYVEILVYESRFSATISWAIGVFGDGFREWLEENLGNEWLYQRYLGLLRLE